MKKALAILLVLVLALGCTPKQEVIPMAIDLDGVGDYITFPNSAAYQNLDYITIFALINADVIDGGDGGGNYIAWKGSGWALNIYNYSSFINRVLFYSFTTATPGIWVSSNDNVVATGSRYLITVSLDRTSINNDPVIYVNGSLIASSEFQTPTGNKGDDSANSIYVGADSGGTNEFNGLLIDLRVYNRILTAAEIADIYNGKSFCDNDYGLVFHAPFLGVAGGVSDGGTMAAANTVIDRIGGVVGTPAGSPVFRADTILSCP